MKCLILNNAYFSTHSTTYQTDRLAEELELLGVECTIRKNDFFVAQIECGEIVNLANEFDFCVYFDKDKYISLALEKAGLRLFNCHDAIQACDDKATCAIMLSNAGIQMPKTLFGLMCYDEKAKVRKESLDYIEKSLGYPIIVKTCCGSMGRGVFKADCRSELRKIAEKLKTQKHLYQECINESLGRDLRIIVVGGEVVAAMERFSETDFRANIAVGGRGKSVEIDEDLKKECMTIANTLNLDFCGIDMLYGKNGYVFCEVNSNAFFDGIEGVTGVNVAEKYARHILNTLQVKVADE